jgi:hypothetical protein
MLTNNKYLISIFYSASCFPCGICDCHVTASHNITTYHPPDMTSTTASEHNYDHDHIHMGSRTSNGRLEMSGRRATGA